MSGCTPGPWTRTHPEFYPIAESRWQIRGSDGELIAAIEKRPKGMKSRGDANGDLLASAPELLEACKQARELLNTEDGDVAAWEMIKLLDAAIGKSVGVNVR